MSRPCLAILFALALPSLALAQTNECGVTPPTNPISNPGAMYLISADHTSVTPEKIPVIADYTFEVRLGTTVVATQAMQKTAFVIQAGTPANCYRANFPSVTVSQSNLYTVYIRANGPGGMSTFVASSNGFFIQGAPAAPESFRLVVSNMLSKEEEILLSIASSNPFYKADGR